MKAESTSSVGNGLLSPFWRASLSDWLWPLTKLVFVGDESRCPSWAMVAIISVTPSRGISFVTTSSSRESDISTASTWSSRSPVVSPVVSLGSITFCAFSKKASFSSFQSFSNDVDAERTSTTSREACSDVFRTSSVVKISGSTIFAGGTASVPMIGLEIFKSSGPVLVKFVLL